MCTSTTPMILWLAFPLWFGWWLSSSQFFTSQFLPAIFFDRSRFSPSEMASCFRQCFSGYISVAIFRWLYFGSICYEVPIASGSHPREFVDGVRDEKGVSHPKQWDCDFILFARNLDDILAKIFSCPYLLLNFVWNLDYFLRVKHFVDGVLWIREIKRENSVVSVVYPAGVESR